MKIINYKDLDKIKPKASIMLYCTCAEKDQLTYLQKIRHWYKHYQHLHHWYKHIDFYVFNDGRILHRNYPLDKNIIVIEFDEKLGRQNNTVFPGWKRSFGYATKLAQKYRYFGHIENDCFIKEINNYYKYLTIDDFVGMPFCVNYKMIETGCMIINNHEILKKISDFFIRKDRQYEYLIFEHQLIKILPDYFNLGNAVRLDGKCANDDPLERLKEDVFCLNQITNIHHETFEKTLLKNKNFWQNMLDKFKNRHYIIDVAGIIRLRVD